MFETHRIDVVILTWNRLEPTRATIASVLRQEGVEVRLWLVDQGSDGETLRALRELTRCEPGRLQLHESGRNLGVPGGRNLGLSLGREEVVVFLDNDAELAEPDSLAVISRRFEEDAKLGAVGFRILNYWTGNDDRLCWVYPRPLWNQRDEPFLARQYCGAGHALRRSAVAKTRGYDESLFFYWEELDLSYQLIDQGFAIAYEPTVRVLHKSDREGRRSWDGDRFYYLVRNRIYLDWKYLRSRWRAAGEGLGYLVKGLVNGVPSQAVRGMVAARRMIRDRVGTEPPPLGPAARAYLRANDEYVRGGLFARVRAEVLERLPR